MAPGLFGAVVLKGGGEMTPSGSGGGGGVADGNGLKNGRPVNRVYQGHIDNSGNDTALWLFPMAVGDQVKGLSVSLSTTASATAIRARLRYWFFPGARPSGAMASEAAIAARAQPASVVVNEHNAPTVPAVPELRGLGGPIVYYPAVQFVANEAGFFGVSLTEVAGSLLDGELTVTIGQ